MLSKFRYHLTGISLVILAGFVAFIDYLWLGTDYRNLYTFLVQGSSDDSIDTSEIWDEKDYIFEEDKTDAEASDLHQPASQDEQIVCSVEQGDTLQSILTKVGISKEQTDAALVALEGKYNPKALEIGQAINFKIENQGKIGEKNLLSMEFNVKSPDAKTTCLLENVDGQFQAVQTVDKLEKILKHAQGSIDSSFYSSAMHKGVPAAIVKKAIAALSYDINMQHDPQRGDKFEIVYTAFVDKNQKVVKTGNLKYVAFAPGGKLKRIYHYESQSGAAGFYDEKGRSVVKTFLKTPLLPTKMKVTSKFNLKGRKHPVLGYSRAHKGVDYGAPHGTPVMASAGGVVLVSRYSPSYGNYVKIRHLNGYETVYAHLSKIYVRRGQKIKQADRIGTVGSTGLAKGAHLHYEVIHCGSHVDPQKLKQAYLMSLAGKELNKFKNMKNRINEEIAGLASGNQYAHNDSVLLN